MAENTLVVRRESTGVPALRATGMRKRFGGIEVLHGVDIELRPGEVHALLGENGAGKSTIINMLSGRLSPDAGRLELNGERIEFKNPLSARRAGISMIAQELEVVPTMSIVENIFLGAEPSWYGLIQWGDARRKVISVLKELGVNAEPGRIVGSMSVADQQLVEIAKAIVGDFHVLIMDEPTSALNLQDTERLFKIVRRLKADGVRDPVCIPPALGGVRPCGPSDSFKRRKSCRLKPHRGDRYHDGHSSNAREQELPDSQC